MEALPQAEAGIIGTGEFDGMENEKKRTGTAVQSPTPLLESYLKLMKIDTKWTTANRKHKRKNKEARKIKEAECIIDEQSKKTIINRLDRMLNPKNPLRITKSDIKSLNIPENRFYTGFANGTPLKAARQALLNSEWSAKNGMGHSTTIDRMVIFMEANLSEVSPMSANFVMEELVIELSDKDAVSNVTCGLGDNPELEYGEWNVLLLFSADDG